MARRDSESPLLHDIEAERSLVGCLVLSPDRAPEIVGSLRPEHFHDPTCRALYAAIASLVDRHEPCDLDGITRELFRAGNDTVTKGDAVRLADALPRGVDWAGIAVRIREGFARRTMRAKLREIADACDRADIVRLRSDLYALLDDDAVSLRRAADDRWEVVATELMTAYDSGVEDAVPSGLIGADRRFGPLPRKSVLVIGARTSVGKTALATTLATTGARAGLRVSFMSVEMDRYRIGQRYLGALTGISLRDLSTRTLVDDDFARIAQVTSESLPICTDDKARAWPDVRSRIRQHARELGGLDLVFIDYVQLVEIESGSGEKRYEALGRLSRGLKQLAQDLNCVVIALAQLNRGADEREEPRLSDLRESGNLEQDADLVWLLWRSTKDRPEAGLAPVRLKVAKNRHGPTGEITVHFRGSAMAFLELADEDEDL